MIIENLTIKTEGKEQMLDITAQVRRIVHDHKIMEGIVTLHVPHTTAAVTINENCDRSVTRDIISTLHELIPPDAGYHHLEGNSDAHIKSSLFGCSQNVLISKGDLILGTWQGIFFCEFDGPRTRKIIIGIREC